MTLVAPLLAGVELGGTKCVCILGTGPEDVRALERIPTTEPGPTLARIADVLESWRLAEAPFEALGIASFGPLDLRPGSPTVGFVTSSAKPGWRNVDVLGRLAARLPVPAGFNTDVNGAALAEGRWGAAAHLPDFAYVTVGTGIGVGLVAGGALILGCSHPELGHVRVGRAAGDRWPGVCAFHGDCAEGLASGPAIAARTGRPAAEVPVDDPVWESVAYTLAQLLHTIAFATAPRRIVIGGGVTDAHPELLPRVRSLLRDSVNGFVDLDDLTGGFDRYVVAPGLGALAGPLGALALAADALAGRGRVWLPTRPLEPA